MYTTSLDLIVWRYIVSGVVMKRTYTSKITISCKNVISIDNNINMFKIDFLLIEDYRVSKLSTLKKFLTNQYADFVKINKF